LEIHGNGKIKYDDDRDEGENGTIIKYIQK